MTIRSATDQDIPAIVELLKLSLGESLMPKSEAFWRWKHIDNPFGRSKVILAIENEKLIGVRAFMHWQWSRGDKMLKAVRAVDTATHPDYQGKGIFRKLTLALVDQCKNEGIDFIFNTPNKVSKPGYLKMGWGSNGKMKIYLKPAWPGKIKKIGFDTQYSIEAGLIPFNREFISNPSHLVTRHSLDLLNWRYAANPNISYYYFTDDKNQPSYLTMFRLKQFRGGLEFRICDTLSAPEMDRQKYKKQLLRVVRESGANIVTSATVIELFPVVALRLGPEITTHPLSFDHNYLTFNFWKPSLGDLEVF